MRRKFVMKRFLLIIFTLIVVLAGCSVNNGEIKNDTNGIQSEYKKISAEEAKKIIDSEEVIILDVRSLDEYNEGHIENAILIPVSEISDKADDMIPDKEVKILVYCRSGNRSAVASKTLVGMGYTNVYDFGGINSWPYSIIKP